MKYIKYLFVEGEINEGDWCKHLPTGKIIYCSYQSVIDKLKEKNFLSQYKKVNPFLCSRDIEVGDKVWINQDTTYEVDHIKGGYIYFGGMSIRGRVGSTFKVIGEISPDVKWVKEGDEIVDFETEMFFKHDNKWYKEQLKDIDLQEKKWFKTIKGPCGHYH